MCKLNCVKLYVTGERKDLTEMAQSVYDALCKSPRMVVIQDIVCSRRDPSGSAALARLAERLTYERFNPQKTEFILFSFHRRDGFQHFHVYHICTYRKSYCSCSFLRNQNTIPARRRTLQKSSISQEDIIRIFKYHAQEGRQICYLAVEGVAWKHFPNSVDDTDGPGIPQGFLEICDDENSNLPKGRRPIESDGAGSEAGGNRTTDGSERRRKAKLIELVNTFLHTYVTTPVRNALCLSEWRNLPNHLLINKQCYKFANIIEDVEFKYLTYTIRDFYDMYSKSDKVIYFKALTMEEYNRKYLSLRDSIISILELLYFQFEHDMDKVDKFLEVIFNMCDFKQSNIKKNSLWVMSPNSAGKNYFFDALVDSFILVGQIKNPIRNYTFGFMNCVNKRILQWNEALVDPYFYEDVKPILAGDSPNVQVKNRDDGVVRATPVFILSNRLSFPDTSEFNCRLHKYEWRTCPLLKLYKRKPDPRAVNILLMCTGDITNVLEADRLLYFQCKTLVKELVGIFGKEYYLDKQYIKFF